VKIYKIAQYKPWEMTRQEFLDYHHTGYISSSAYDDYSTVDGLSWIKKEKYPVLYSVKNFGKYRIEFRKSGEKLKYTAIDPNDDLKILRDEKGMALMLTDDEIKSKGLPTEDLTIAAFDGDKAIGLASDEWGTDGVWVVKDYQKLGIGVYLLSELRKQHEDKRKIGQMTDAGYNMSGSYHKKEVKDALDRGDLNPNSPKYEEIIKDYPELKS